MAEDTLIGEEPLPEPESEPNKVLHYAVHDPEGRILRYGKAADEDGAALQGDGSPVLVFAITAPEDPPPEISDATHWIEGGALTARPMLPEPSKATIAADGEDSAEFIAVPVGTAIVTRAPDGGETRYTIETTVPEDVEFIAIHSGTYLLDMQPPFPFLPRLYEITAL